MPQDDLVAQLRILYRAAGQPSYRRISSEVRDREDMPDTVSHETVNGLLNGGPIPRWSKVEAVVRVLAEMAAHRPNPQAEAQRFLALWNEQNDNRATGPASPANSGRPSAPATGSEPPNGSVPPRNIGFTGREEILARMRKELATEPWQPLVLHGLSGVGKTSLANEYVHREMHHFDVVWWIVAEQVARTRSALVALGERLPEPPEISQSDMGQTVSKVLGALEQAGFTWLLVFDNAADPEQILELLPAGQGTVIVTSRDGSWSKHARTIPVDVLPRSDSIALLQSKARISFDDADRLADRLGDLPLALEQASAIQAAAGMSVQEYLRRLDHQATALLSEGRPRDYPETVASAFTLAYDELRRESPGAGKLLAMLSCMSAEPISLALLQAADERSIPPPLGRVLAQDAQLDATLHVLERYGLLTAAEGAQKVQVHRLVQLVVRDSLPEADREQAYRDVRSLLVAANPGEPDNPLTWEMHAQIGPHIGPAQLISAPEPGLRRVVLDHIWYLYLLGDFDGSLRLSTEALQVWSGPDNKWNDDETFACVDRYALALIGLGRYREADAVYDDAWIKLNNHPRFGARHDRTAGTANGVAMISRILGSYGKALNLERYRLEYYLETRSLDDPDLLRARNNQAVCYRAIGDYAKAYEIDEELVAQWQRIFGAEDYRTQFAISNLARDLYGLGDYRQALQMQEESLTAMQDQLDARHPSMVLAMRTIAIALRKVGRIGEALQASREHFLVCQGELGSENGHTLAAAMTYANAIRVAVTTGQGGDLTFTHAYNISLRTASTYRARFGERNPLSLAAAVNHAIILRATGDRSTARRTSDSAYRILLNQVGAAHPYTQAAAVGLANDFAAQQDLESATRLLRTTLDSSRTARRDQHPDVLAGAVNLGLLLRDRDPADARSLLEPSLAALRAAQGPEHPQVLAAANGSPLECDIEPPPF